MQAIANVSADNGYIKVALRPLLKRCGILKPVEAHVGTVKLDKMQIRQKNGGPNHGKFVGHDPVVLIKKQSVSNANRLIKSIVGPPGEDGDDKGFMSRDYVDAGYENVSLLNICIV
jgi:hypothetical protein